MPSWASPGLQIWPMEAVEGGVSRQAHNYYVPILPNWSRLLEDLAAEREEEKPSIIRASLGWSCPALSSKDPKVQPSRHSEDLGYAARGKSFIIGDACASIYDSGCALAMCQQEGRREACFSLSRGCQ